MERRNATSSVSQVSADQLERVPAVSIENALQGKVLGASINMNNGAPGGGGQIQIRGASSLIGKIDPLYVIDGVIVSNDVRSNNQRFITNSLNAGEENGTNDPTTATTPLGSRITAPNSSIGSVNTTMIGICSVCVSFMSPAAAPTAMNSEPYTSTASTRFSRNQAISGPLSSSVTP